MSRKRANNRRSGAQRRPAVIPPRADRAELAKRLREDREAAAATVEETDREPVEQATPPQDLDEAALDAAWAEAAQSHDLFRRAAEELDQRTAVVADKEERLDARLAEAQQGIDELERRESELAERERTLLDGERELLAGQEKEKTLLLSRGRESLQQARLELEERQSELIAEHERTRGVLRAELDARHDELTSRIAELATERGRLRERDVELTAREEDVEDTRKLLAERIQRAVATAVQDTELRCRELEHRVESLLKHAEELRQRLAEHERAGRAFGFRPPQEVLAELEELRRSNAELRAQRAVPEGMVERLAGLEDAQRRWREERAVLVSDNEQLRRRLQGHQITAMELERLQVAQQSAEASVRSYRVHLEDMRRDIEGLTERKEGESPFPECVRMDEDHAEPVEDLLQELPPLEEFTGWLHHFAADRYRMFYAREDLAMFLGGLAASRLHLLQGISGIGKTQLPLVFAQAIQAQAAVVPVSADWRTPQDLVGYFNAFERRFYESEFTQALYRANCPEFRYRPFLVVLDEMNLSHPEQYFSEVLYQIGRERRKGDPPRALTLMTTTVRPAPRGLDSGRRLVIPPNVWFIGTANHDETTVAFADKTYDRSHVVELPSRPKRFQPSSFAALDAPPSLRALKRSFAQAREARAQSAHNVAAFLEGELGDRLLRDFRITSGARADRYLQSFVPVACAAGLTESEAADHVVATRLLRKLHGRFEIPIRFLDGLREDLPGMWRKQFSTEPVRSLHKLEEEIRLRGGV